MDEKIAMLESAVASLQSIAQMLSAQLSYLSSDILIERTERQAADAISGERIRNLELLINDAHVE